MPKCRMNHEIKLNKGSRTIYLFPDGCIARLVAGCYVTLGTISRGAFKAWRAARLADGYHEVDDLGLPV